MKKIEISQIPTAKIITGKHASRLEVDTNDLDDLCASISRIGIIVPLLVRHEGDTFLVLAGHRRLAAAQALGLAAVPCCVREDTEASAVEINIAENLFRTDLTPLEQASAIKDILAAGVISVDNVARMMHRSDHWVNAQLDMLTWPADILETIHNGRLSVSAASNLALITDNDYRSFLIRNAADAGATARTTAAWLQAWRSQMPPEAAVEQPPVEGADRSMPALPQAPCLVCNQMQRTDGLAMVMVCTSCIAAIRSAAVKG